VKKVFPKTEIRIGSGIDVYGRGGYASPILDISRAKEELGYSPKFTLEQGIADYAETLSKILKHTPNFLSIQT